MARPYRFPAGYRVGGGISSSRGVGLPSLGKTANVTVQPNVRSATNLARRLNGTFRGGRWQDALADAHDRMSAELRAKQVQVLNERRSGRVRRPTNYLAMTISDPRNSLVTPHGFQVGIVSWLSRSPAKMYWRRIEFGGPNPMARVGRVGGYFWSGGGKNFAPGAGAGQARFTWWNDPRGFTIDPVDAASEGYHYMSEGWRRYRASNGIYNAYRDTFRSSVYGLSNYVRLIPRGSTGGVR
jgi:hypothetical protein